MKAAAFLMSVCAWAQTANREAVRVGQVQAVNLESSAADGKPSITGADGQPRVVVAQDPRAPNGVPVTVSLGAAQPTLVPVGSQAPAVLFETWAEQLPRQYAESVSAGFSAVDRGGEKIVMHRYVMDGIRRIQAGYDITAEILPEAGAYRLSFEPSAAGPEPRGNWKRIFPSWLPSPQVVRDGGMVAVELYTDENTGRRLVEYVHIGHPSAGLPLRKEAARDIFDGDAKIQVAQGRLSVNGLAQEPRTVADASVWCYLPGRGRFEFSLRSKPGFVKSGELQGQALMFHAGRDIVQIESSERIAPGSGTYNVYVREDPSWRPAVEIQSAAIGTGQ